MLPRPLPGAPTIWLGIIGGASLLDWYLDQGEPDNDTCSEQIRRLFVVHTPLGKAAFTLALAGGATWLHSHICKTVVYSQTPTDLKLPSSVKANRQWKPL